MFARRLLSASLACKRPVVSSARFMSAAAEQDLVVIGGGPGGYVAAIKAAQLGMSVTCVEKRGTLGGTCLNVGCIPSKALLNSSHKYEEAVKSFAGHGIILDKAPRIDVATMMKQKATAVAGLTKGIEQLFKKNKVTYVKGTGRFESPGVVAVDGLDGQKQLIKAKNVLIATGSDAVEIPFMKFDEKVIVSSTGALSLPTIPKTMVVIGGGYIGLEMGSVWRRLGTEVTVVEFFDRIVPAMDLEIGKAFQKSLEKQGLKFKLSTKVTGATVRADGATLTVEPAKGGAAEKLNADVVLVSVGRKPHTSTLGLDKVGVNVDDKGRVVVNSHYATNVPGVFAIGDVIAGPMLAHKAEEEGIAAVEFMAGKHGHVNYDCIPGVVYTHPEVATVGLTEEQVKEKGIKYRVGKFPFVANSRARTNDDTEGLVKIISDAATDRVLGVHIIGSSAGEGIAECVLAMEYGASSEDIARTCHAHPTLSEAIKEAAMSATENGKAIHF